MKRFLQKLARKFFQRYIRVYQISNYISPVELVTSKRFPIDHIDHYKRDMVRRISNDLYESGMIEFEERKDYRTDGVELRAKIRVI